MNVVALESPSGCVRAVLYSTIMTGLAMMPSMGQAMDYSASAYVDYTQLNIDREQFTPHLARFKFDAVVPKGDLQGMGVQLVVGVPMRDDESNDVTVEVGSHYGLYFTFVDYTTDDIRLGVSLGISSTDVDTTFETNGNKAGDTFQSGSFGLSLQDNIGPSKNTHWILECLQYFKVDDVKMAGCGLGVKYDF